MAATLALFTQPAKADHVTTGNLFTNLVFTNGTGTFTINGGNIIRLPKDTGVALLVRSGQSATEEPSTFELRWSFSNDAVKWTSPQNIAAAVDGYEALAGTLASPKRDYEYYPQTVFGAVNYAKIAEIRLPTGFTNTAYGYTNFNITVDYSFFNSGVRSTNLPTATATATLIASAPDPDPAPGEAFAFLLENGNTLVAENGNRFVLE